MLLLIKREVKDIYSLISGYLKSFLDGGIGKERIMEENLTTSPTPQKAKDAKILLTFYEALEEVMKGKKITRVEWKNKDTYGLLVNGHLSLHMNRETYDWIVTDGDMTATDWFILSESN